MGRQLVLCKGYAYLWLTLMLQILLQTESVDPMNAPSDFSMKTDDVLRVELEVFRREHRDMDDAIVALHSHGRVDPLTLQRLKKRKLHLKDAIAVIEDRLTPDITA